MPRGCMQLFKQLCSNHMLEAALPTGMSLPAKAVWVGAGGEKGISR